MNKDSFQKILKIMGLLFLCTFIYGAISFNLMPVYQMIQSMNRFNVEGLVTGKSVMFLNVLLLIFVLLEPKKILSFISISYPLNLLIVKLISNQWEFFYCFNISAIAIFIIFIRFYLTNINKRPIYNYGLFIGFISIFFGYMVITTLQFMQYILPNVYDTKAIFIDSFYHIPKDSTQIFYGFLEYFPESGIIYQFLYYIYNLLGLAIITLAFWEYKENRNRFFVNTMVALGLLFIIGACTYILFPVMGPKYLQLSINNENYDYYKFLNNQLTNSVYPRNGMPSLHFALSLFLVLNSYGLSIGKRLLFFCFFILTACATIILKEHYLIDWVGALPILVLTILLADTHLSFKIKKWLLLLNILNILIWYAFLWFGITLNTLFFACVSCNQFNISMTLMLYSLTLLTVINTIYSYKCIYNNKNHLEQKNVMIKDELVNFSHRLKSLKNKENGLTILTHFSIFSFSVYQVVFGIKLESIFQSPAIILSIIILTTMIGLCFGSWLGSKNITPTPAIIKYALIKGLIAIYCVLTPVIFTLISEVYFSLAKLNLESVLYVNTLKIILGILGLIVPTILTGMTKPLLLNELNEKSDKLNIYTLSTSSAAIGSFISGYFLIKILGVTNTIYLTVLFNLLICAFAINNFKKKNSNQILNQSIKDFFNEFSLMFKRNHFTIEKNSQFYFSSFILFISGILTMVIETVYTHMLSVVVGNSVYFFSSMLFSFLVGLTIGGKIGKKLIQQLTDNFKKLFYLQCALGISITITYFLIDLVPDYFASVGNSPAISTFESREFLRVAICFGIMIIPTIILGMIYTLSMNALSLSQEEQTNNVIGYGLYSNIIGNILGVFLGSFYFINKLQINGSFKVLTLCALATSVIVLINNLKQNKKEFLLPLALIMIVLFNPYEINMNKITSGNNVHFVNSSRGEVVEYKDNADSGLTSVNKTMTENKPIFSLVENGNFQGNITQSENLASFAPMLHISHKNQVLVIGYNTGITTKLLYDANFKNIDVIESSSDILRLADKYFSSINGNVRHNDNVNSYITDAKKYLKLTDKKYDLINMTINSTGFVGESYLYNKEFYEIAKNKLSENGVLQQSVQLQHMNPNDFYIILNTIRNQFKYVNLYYIENHGIVVATNSAENKDIQIENIKELNNNQHLNNIRLSYLNDFNNIAKYRLLNSQQIDKMLLAIYGKNVNYFISTDDNLYLEYKIPQGNVLKLDTENIIVSNLLKYQNP